MQAPLLVSGPASQIFDLTDIKDHLRISSSDEDTYLTFLIKAATAYLDGYTGQLGRCLINQDWKLQFEDWPNSNGRLRLPFPDVSNVVVKYFDTENAEQTVSETLYQIIEDHRSSILCFSDDFTEPSVFDDRQDAVQITLTAGYGADKTFVPEAIRHGMLLLIGHWFENREAVVVNARPEDMPLGFNALIAPYRKTGL